MEKYLNQTTEQWRFLRSLPIWRHLLLLLGLYWLIMLSAAAMGQSERHHLENREHGGFELKRMHAADGFEAVPSDALLLSSHVNVDITGLIVRTSIRQRFKNTTNDWIEGTYRFPLPDGSVVDALTMIIGERRIVGKIKEKAEARRIYQQAIKVGKKAALLNQARPNMFTTKVGNVAPGSKIEVELQFLSLAEQNGLAFSWRLPQAITPRYGAEGQMEDSGDRPLPAGMRQYALSHQPASMGRENRTSFAIRLNAGTPVTGLASPSHDLAVTDQSDGRFDIALRNGALPADRDFVLRWTLEQSAAAKPVFFKETFEGETYLLGFVLPPSLQSTAVPVPPRDVAFILDTSGSMHGLSITQAKAALMRALDLLRSQDRFDIILFNNDFTRLFGGSQEASLPNLAEARRLVRSIEANGGTEMKGALSSVLADGHDAEALRQIMFLTDGAVGYEEDMFRMVDRDLGRARLFTVGLGSAPNGWFMRKAAEFGRGLHVQVDHLDQAQAELEALFADMAQPSMSGLELECTGEMERFPAIMPDLFGDRPALFVAKLAAGSTKVSLSGLSLGGEIWSQSIDLATVRGGADIAKLWARKKVEHLMDEKVRGMPAFEAKAAILQTALKHAIMSPHTSFVAVEDKVSRNRAEALKRSQLKGNLPHGTDAKKFSGPSTASPMAFRVMTGLLLLILAGLVWLCARRSAPSRVQL